MGTFLRGYIQLVSFSTSQPWDFDLLSWWWEVSTRGLLCPLVSISFLLPVPWSVTGVLGFGASATGLDGRAGVEVGIGAADFGVGRTSASKGTGWGSWGGKLSKGSHFVPFLLGLFSSGSFKFQYFRLTTSGEKLYQTNSMCYFFSIKFPFHRYRPVTFLIVLSFPPHKFPILILHINFNVHHSFTSYHMSSPLSCPIFSPEHSNKLLPACSVVSYEHPHSHPKLYFPLHGNKALYPSGCSPDKLTLGTGW